MAPTFSFTSGEPLAPGNHISFGSFDFIASATDELRLADAVPSIDALTQAMDGLLFGGPAPDAQMEEAERLTPADHNVEALSDQANALLRPFPTSEDRDQVLYALANVVTQLHGNPPLPSMAALQGTAPDAPPSSRAKGSASSAPAVTKAKKRRTQKRVAMAK